MGWPGLAKEIHQICHQKGLPDATNKNIVLDKATVKGAIKVNYLQYLKDDMKGQKLKVMKRTDMRERHLYIKFIVDEYRVAFQLEVHQYNCRANIPTRYKRDLQCRACGPDVGGHKVGEQAKEQNEGEQAKEQNVGEQEKEQNVGEQEKEQNEDEEKEQQQDEWKIEDQEHLEIYPGHRELWDVLGPISEQSLIRYIMILQLKELS